MGVILPTSPYAITDLPGGKDDFKGFPDGTIISTTVGKFPVEEM